MVVLRPAFAAVATIEHEELKLLHDDYRHGRQHLTTTLRTWLECGRDVKETAAIMHLHPNTVRHRLKRTHQLVGNALQTHTQRLATLMLLRGWDEAQSEHIE